MKVHHSRKISMFTGIIQGIGTVSIIEKKETTNSISVDMGLRSNNLENGWRMHDCG